MGASFDGYLLNACTFLNLSRIVANFALSKAAVLDNSHNESLGLISE